MPRKIRIISQRVIVPLIAFLLVVLQQHRPGVTAFAAWLKCYVDLLDADEIIMNQMIIPASQALHEGVEIEVKRAAQDDDDDDDWGPSLTYPANAKTLVMARLKVPPPLSKLDVQYVMDTISTATNGSSSSVNDDNNDDDSDVGARFQQAVCEGRRAHASHYATPLVLEIDGTTENVQLVAGYAAGHEAVTLTPALVLQRQRQDDDEEEEL